MNQVSSSLQIGAGVGRTISQRSFTQGTIQNTGGSTDVAIQGDGFFILKTSSGSTTYTRDGAFSINASGQLVTQTGELVQGWNAVNGVFNTSGAVSPIVIPAVAAQSPTPTANISTSANLNATAAVGTTFDVPVQVVDSLGNLQTVTIEFKNTAPLQWDYTVTIPGEAVSGGTPGTPTTITTGSLTFDSTGVLTSPAAGAPVNLTSPALADGADPLNVNWNLFDASGNPMVTQYASPSASLGITQDGVQAAMVTGTSLQNGGLLVATFSDGTQRTVAQLALASIANPSSMLALANNQYSLGADSATPTTGAAGTGTRGQIVGGSLESSNVDMATQLTNLIVYQRAYQANSKAITSIDQMQQTLIALNL